MTLSSPYTLALFDPLRPWLNKLPPNPDAQALAALAEASPVYTAQGQPVRFVPPQEDGLGYEHRIRAKGEVETQPDNWHDFFNALVWFAFPQAKSAVSASHAEAMAAIAGNGEVDVKVRGKVRDALTHFDECGIVVLSDQAELLDLMRNFAWKPLFVERRTEVMQHLRFIIFGHATYESLLKPFRGLTAKAILYEVDANWLQLPLAQQIVTVDARLAADLSSGRYTRPRDFQPLPLLGIPGVTAESEDPAYYDDTWQFRPGRRQPA
ncbi:MAG: DUF3025 domain-containing protein [Rhodocyclaceae bacterium]|nr:DUF3025 domain-containing protein [Rhodocyclaceae bacterium]